jgi:hypothetical protein
MGMVLVCAPNVQAQDADAWLLLPSSTGATSRTRHAARALSTALAGNPSTLDPKLVRARFEQRGSTEPLMVSHSDLDLLARDAQTALYHVASGLHAKAKQDVERALARADKVLESLNRESMAARQLLDACLYLVRAHLDGNDRERARAQALECRRLVPDIEPDGTMHPPAVIGMLAEAEADLRLRHAGSLRVESAPDGCAVFVNGRRLGTAPLELPQLGPGEYRVQAECQEGVPGRVHRATIGTTRVVVRVDTRFDAAVQTSLDLALRYPDLPTQASHAYSDAVEVGRIVGTHDVVLLSSIGDTDPRLVQAERIRVSDGALMAAVRMRVDDNGVIDQAPQVAAALRDGARVDFTGAAATTLAVQARPVAPPVATAPPPPVANPATTPADLAAIEPTDEPAEHGPPHAVGVVLASTGGAALLTGWGLYFRQLSLELEYSDQKKHREDFTQTLQDLEDGELLAPIVGGAGALIGTISLPWLLPDEPNVPAWAAVLGGTGTAMVVAGTVLLVTGASCDDFDVQGRCKDIVATTRLGAMLAETGLPLAAMPVTYWIRSATGDDTASLTVGPELGGGWMVHMRGAL